MRVHLLLVLIVIQRLVAESGDLKPRKKLHLKAAAYHHSPLMMIKKIDEKNFTMTGLAYEVMNVLEKSLNIEFEYILLDPAEVANYGIPLAGIRQLQRGEVDISPNMYVRSYERFSMFEITSALLVQHYLLLMRRPEEESRLFIPFKPFSTMVWWAILLVVVLVTAVTTIFVWKKQKNKRKHSQSPQNSFTKNVFTATHIILLRETNSYDYRRLPNFLLFSTWTLMISVLMYSYMTNMISYLTVPILKPIPNSFEELAKASEYKLTLERDYVITKTILASKSGPMKVLGDSMRANPYLLTKTTDEAVAAVFGRGHAYSGGSGFIYYIMGEDMIRNQGKCRYAVSKTLEFQQTFGFGLPLKGAYNEMFNQELLRMFETQLHDEIYNRYSRKRMTEKCKIKKKRTQLKILHISDVSGCFMILGIGEAAAFCVFILENIVWMIQKRRSKYSFRNFTRNGEN